MPTCYSYWLPIWAELGFLGLNPWCAPSSFVCRLSFHVWGLLVGSLYLLVWASFPCVWATFSLEWAAFLCVQALSWVRLPWLECKRRKKKKSNTWGPCVWALSCVPGAGLNLAQRAKSRFANGMGKLGPGSGVNLLVGRSLNL